MARSSRTEREGNRERIYIPAHVRAQMLQLARDFRSAPTPSEELLWQSLRRRQLGRARFRRQQPIGPFIVDFFCPRYSLIVEVDGPIHNEQIDRDRARQALLEACGYRVLRVTAAEVERDVQAVIRQIGEIVADFAGHPCFTELPSPLEGEGPGERGIVYAYGRCQFALVRS